MNIQRLLACILMLILPISQVYAAGPVNAKGTINELLLQRNEIKIDDRIYTVRPNLPVTSALDTNVANIYQLKIEMTVEFSFEVEPDGTESIRSMRVVRTPSWDSDSY